MNRLRDILVGGAVLGLATFGVIDSANAHWDQYAPNHAHVCTASTSLNVRSGPGTNYSTVGSVNKGSKVTIKATYSDWETNDLWYKIYLSNGSTGYVSGDYVCF